LFLFRHGMFWEPRFRSRDFGVAGYAILVGRSHVAPKRAPAAGGPAAGQAGRHHHAEFPLPYCDARM